MTPTLTVLHLTGHPYADLRTLLEAARHAAKLAQCLDTTPHLSDALTATEDCCGECLGALSGAIQDDADDANEMLAGREWDADYAREMALGGAA